MYPAVFEEYGEGDGQVLDEGEMRRVVMGRARGWVDWAVGWMDFRGEEEEDGSENEEEDEGGRGDTDAGDSGMGRGRKKKTERSDVGNADDAGQAVAGPAPDGPQSGMLADARWLLGVATKIVV